ncbi:MAG: mandelate racemase/muconate lactonizing enzyme family protein [Kineosporiaceae bacterium]
MTETATPTVPGTADGTAPGTDPGLPDGRDTIGDLRISRIESHLSPDGAVAVVRVRTTDGAEGIGQVAARNAHISVAVLHDLVAPLYLGASAWDVGALSHRVPTELYKFSGTFLYRALGGVDTALYDLLGKAVGQPVHRLVGGGLRARVPVYASSLNRKITPEDEAERMARAVDEHGFRGIKVKIGQRMGGDVDVWPGRTERMIERVSASLGDHVHLVADANGGFTAGRAIEVGRRLEAHGFDHLEEPCPFQEYANTKRVADALDIAVGGGEQDNALPVFERLIHDRVVDIVQPDVCYVGGFTRALQVARMAEAAGIPCTPHCSTHSMIQVFTLHLAAAAPSLTQRQEWRLDEDPGWCRDLFEPVPRVVDGLVDVPTGPGWGIEPSAGFLARAEVRASAR